MLSRVTEFICSLQVLPICKQTTTSVSQEKHSFLLLNGVKSKPTSSLWFYMQVIPLQHQMEALFHWKSFLTKAPGKKKEFYFQIYFSLTKMFILLSFWWRVISKFPLDHRMGSLIWIFPQLCMEKYSEKLYFWADKTPHCTYGSIMKRVLTAIICFKLPTLISS